MKVQVNVVPKVPFLSSPHFVSGITDKESARAWGEKNGYSLVYYLESAGRVYADRLTVRVDVQAEQIQRKSKDLLRMTERGGAGIENAILLAITVIVVFLVGDLLGWPW